MINKYSISIIICLLAGLIFIVLRSQVNLRNEMTSLEVIGKITQIQYREKEMPFFT